MSTRMRALVAGLWLAGMAGVLWALPSVRPACNEFPRCEPLSGFIHGGAPIFGAHMMKVSSPPNPITWAQATTALAAVLGVVTVLLWNRRQESLTRKLLRMVSVWCFVAGVAIAPGLNTDYVFDTVNPRPAIALAGFTLWLTVNMLFSNRFSSATRVLMISGATLTWLISMFLVMAFFTPTQGPCACAPTPIWGFTWPQTIVMFLGNAGFVFMTAASIHIVRSNRAREPIITQGELAAS